MEKIKIFVMLHVHVRCIGINEKYGNSAKQLGHSILHNYTNVDLEIYTLHFTIIDTFSN